MTGGPSVLVSEALQEIFQDGFCDFFFFFSLN